MADWKRVLALCCVCVLVATAGCAGAQDADTPGENTTTPDNGTTDETPQVDPDNPYGQRTLTVAVNQSAAERDLLPSIDNALSYWESNSERYAGYPIEYELAPNASDAEADVVIAARESIDRCGKDTTYAGCAPLVNTSTSVPDTVLAEIATDYTLRSTNATLRHELGHTLGLDHDDEPAALMGTNTSRGFTADPVRVHYTLSDQSHAHDEEETQIRESIAYVERASASWLNASVNATFVDDPTRADVLVNLTYSDVGCEYEGSCVRYADTAGHLYHDQAEIVVMQDEPEVVGMHVATNWLLMYRSMEDLPEFFRDPDPGEPYEEWWEDDPRPAGA